MYEQCLNKNCKVCVVFANASYPAIPSKEFSGVLTSILDDSITIKENKGKARITYIKKSCIIAITVIENK